jgi:hypothetical protein
MSKSKSKGLLVDIRISGKRSRSSIFIFQLLNRTLLPPKLIDSHRISLHRSKTCGPLTVRAPAMCEPAVIDSVGTEAERLLAVMPDMGKRSRSIAS